MSSAHSPFIPAVDDAWAILSEPPGTRDLQLPDHWHRSLERSRRRREARRALAAQRATTRVGLTVAATAFGGTLAAAGTGGAGVAQATTYSLELSRGSKGPAVKALQRRLGIAADGIFGPQTHRAVKRFQKRNGIPAIGRVGPRTTAALGLTGLKVKRRTKRVRTRRTAKRVAGPPAVRLSRAAARAMQGKLGVAVDGVIGPQTRRALKRYEARVGLPADGRPDAQVLASLGVNRDTAPEASEPKSVEQGSTAPAAGKGAAAAVRHALAVAGTPYAYGGTGPRGFDCSGLTQYAFRKAGISLPRTSFAQYGMGTPIKRRQIQAGDLVFFDASGPGASHVGIATGPSTVVSATTRGVMEHAISDGYWGSHYVGARRV